MKTTIPLMFAFAGGLLSLVGCNTTEGENETPVIESVHSSLTVQAGDSRDDIDMDLEVYVVVNDPDGYSNLDTATIRFPGGQSHVIDLTDELYEEGGQTGLEAYFDLSDVAKVNGVRELLMTGYSVTLTDKGGLSDEQSFDLAGFDGAAVPMGAYLVHPGDYPVSSGGDYIEGLHIPVIHSASVGTSDISINMSIDDDRVYDLTFLLHDADGHFIGLAIVAGQDNLTLSGPNTYTVSFSDIRFKDGYSIDDLAKIRVFSGDQGSLSTGFAADISQQLAESALFSL